MSQLNTLLFSSLSKVTLLSLSIFAACAIPSHSSAQTVQLPTRISVSPSGIGGNASSTTATLSPNGGYIAFRSSASNLTNSDTNFVADIFLQDTRSNTIARISEGFGGTESDGESLNPTISATTPNGFFAVAFESNSTNIGLFKTLVPDSNLVKDIYFSIPLSGLTERVSMGPGGVVANGESREPSITVAANPETILVAFTSDASNLIANDTNQKSDIFLATFQPPTNGSSYFTSGLSISRVSEATGGVQSNGNSSKPVISGDGRYVVFQSDATNLFTVTGIPTASQIYMYDVLQKTTTLVSRTAVGAPGNGASSLPSISYSGSYVTYLTQATNLVSDDQIPQVGGLQIMRFNIGTGITERVNVSSTGILSNTSSPTSMSAKITPDGRSVIFTDSGSNLVAGDTNNKVDTFIRDMVSKSTTLLSSSFSGGVANDASFDASGAGTTFTALTLTTSFTSFASNIVQNDSEGRTDIFSASAALQPQTIIRNFSLETPADLTLGSSRSFSVGMLQLQRLPIAKASSKKSSKVQYRVVATRTSAPKKDVRTKLATRNLVNFKNLPPGTYTVSYRAEALINGKIKAKTKFSSPQSIVVQ